MKILPSRSNLSEAIERILEQTVNTSFSTPQIRAATLLARKFFTVKVPILGSGSSLLGSHYNQRDFSLLSHSLTPHFDTLTRQRMLFSQLSSKEGRFRRSTKLGAGRRQKARHRRLGTPDRYSVPLFIKLFSPDFPSFFSGRGNASLINDLVESNQ